MQLTYNRYTVAVLIVLIVVTLSAIIAGIFAVSAQPARARTCGSIYIYSFTCRLACFVDGSCGGGINRIKCTKHNIDRWTNPFTSEDRGLAGYQYYCTNTPPDCPSFCLP